MNFETFWDKYGQYVPLLIVSILIAFGDNLPGDFLPLFLLSVVMIAEADMHKEIAHHCYKLFASFFSLIILLCLVKYGKIKKWIAILIVSLFFSFLIFVKKQYDLI